jgi:hypothetical protein
MPMFIKVSIVDDEWEERNPALLNIEDLRTIEPFRHGGCYLTFRSVGIAGDRYEPIRSTGVTVRESLTEIAEQIPSDFLSGAAIGWAYSEHQRWPTRQDGTAE